MERAKILVRILERANFLFITLNSCGRSGVSAFKADVAFFDEGGQIKLSDIGIPLTQMPTIQAGMILGDPVQLLPYQVSGRANEFRLNGELSILGMLQMKEYPIIYLQEQRRCAPEIMDWPSRYIYNGRVSSHTSVLSYRGNEHRERARLISSRFYNIRSSGPEQGCELWMSDVVHGTSRAEEDETSLHNDAYAAAIATFIRRLLDSGASPCDIAVLTYYNRQKPVLVKRLRERLSTSGGVDWEVSSQYQLSFVDAFQGQECEYVCLDFVIAHGKSKTNHESDPNDIDDGGEYMAGNLNKTTAHVRNIHRLACALTRAKACLHIFGQTASMVSKKRRLTAEEAAVSETCKDLKARGLIYKDTGHLDNSEQGRRWREMVGERRAALEAKRQDSDSHVFLNTALQCTEVTRQTADWVRREYRTKNRHTTRPITIELVTEAADAFDRGKPRIPAYRGKRQAKKGNKVSQAGPSDEDRGAKGLLITTTRKVGRRTTSPTGESAGPVAGAGEEEGKGKGKAVERSEDTSMA